VFFVVFLHKLQFNNLKHKAWFILHHIYWLVNKYW